MNRDDRLARLHSCARERILVLDGAMGTMQQGYGLGEAEFRGTCFHNHTRDLKGNNDVLVLTQPHIVREIHEAYLEAGADILETSSFTTTSISQADYALEAHAREMNVAAAGLARAACDAFEARDGQPRWVAGAIGPTNKTCSISPDVNDPGRRDVTFDGLAASYKEQSLGLIEGGADILLIETIFDTLNAKAALWGVEDAFEEAGVRLPVMISGTITDLSGRTLSGQTTEAFWYSLRHARPFSIGLNCALGPKELRPYIAELARISDALVSVHPNAGLPNEFGGYDETPADMAAVIGEFASAGLVNIVGGCCGTTPDHIRAIAASVRGVPPRRVPDLEVKLRLAGLEPFVAAA